LAGRTGRGLLNPIVAGPRPRGWKPLYRVPRTDEALSMTRFERARILGARALQISMGAPPLLSLVGDPIEIATKELADGLLPMTSARLLHARD